MAEIAAKHATRIHDLIKAKRGVVVLLFVGFLLPLLSPILILVGLLYGYETSRLLRLYPDLESAQAIDLRSARTAYLATAFVHLGLWLAVAAGLTIVLYISR